MLLIAFQIALAICLLAAAMAPLTAPANAEGPEETQAATEFPVDFEADLEGGVNEDLELEEDCLEFAEELEEEAEEFCSEDEEVEASEADECPLRSASAHAVKRHNKLKVTIGYTTYEPTSAKIQIRKFGAFKRHLGRSGVLRFTKTAGKRGAKKLVVQIKAANGSQCAPRRLVLFPH